jgi:hypothetical protein
VAAPLSAEDTLRAQVRDLRLENSRLAGELDGIKRFIMAESESKLGVEPGKYPSTQTRNTDPGTIQAASFREAKLVAENRDKPDTQKWGGRQS